MNNLQTIRFSYLRFLTIQVVVCAGYSIVNYVLLQRITWLSDAMRTFVLPAFTAVVAYVYYYRSRMKVVPKFMTDEFRVWIMVFMLVLAPPIILQVIIDELATRTIRVGYYETIPSIKGKLNINLMTAAHIDTLNVGLYCKTYTVYHKNSRDDRHYAAYIVAPVLKPAASQGTWWFGKTFSHIDRSDNSRAEAIKKKLDDMKDTIVTHFCKIVKRQPIDRLAINTSSPEFLDFSRAVDDSGSSSKGPILIATEVTPRKSIAFKTKTFLITLGITQLIWFIVCLFIRVSDSGMRNYEALSLRQRRDQASADFREAFFWIIPSKNYLVTPLILIANITVYVIMGAVGIGFDTPDGNEMIKWGSNFGPLVHDGQWWRLLTAGFLHFGLIHIMMNMLALGFAGTVMERVIGSSRMSILYLVSVLGCSIVSNYAHHFNQNGAGASGGVFGILGAMLLYAVFGLANQENRTIMILMVVFFALPTFIIGLVGFSSADNSGHAGGLVTGMIVSLFFIPKVKTAGEIGEELE